MTLLEIITSFCKLRALPVPSAAYGSADPQVGQMVALLERAGIDLASRGTWQELTNEATLTTIADEDQGEIDSIATDGFRYILPDTIWDRTNNIPLFGPMTGAEWQRNKAYDITGPRYAFRIRRGHLYISPAPSASLSWAFEYMSKNWIETADGSGVYRDRFNSDDNVPLLPAEVLEADLSWRWRKEKGLAYAEDFNAFERMVADYLGRSGGTHRTLSMDGESQRVSHGVSIPAYSWDLP